MSREHEPASETGEVAELMARAPDTSPPAAVRAAIKASVLAGSLGGEATPARIGGRYRLCTRLGRGANGVVWEAVLEPIGRRVAVKLLRPRASVRGDGAPRLLREALAVSRIGHDHIVRCDDIGTDEHGTPYLVMELLTGRSLADAVAVRGAFSWPEVATIAAQICDALAAAHRLGVVHRDVKPANVFLVERDDGRPWIKLLDFGLCKSSEASAETLTEAGTILGTPGYMAPEQIRGEALDGRADLYSLGCVMIELLGGRPVFVGTGPADVLAAQLEDRRERVADILPQLPADACAVIERAMATRPEDRHRDAVAMGTAIAAVGARTRAPSSTAGSSKTARQVSPRAGAGIGRGYVLGVVTTVAFALGIAIVQRRHRSSEEPANASSGSANTQPEAAPMPIATPPRVAPSEREPVPPPKAAVMLPAADEPIATPALAPAPAPRRVTRKRRADRAPENDASASAPAPVRKLADGIRDPFDGL